MSHGDMILKNLPKLHFIKLSSVNYHKIYFLLYESFFNLLHIKQPLKKREQTLKNWAKKQEKKDSKLKYWLIMPFQTHMSSKQLHIKERLKGQTQWFRRITPVTPRFRNHLCTPVSSFYNYKGCIARHKFCFSWQQN